MGIRRIYEQRPAPTPGGQWSRLIAGSIGAGAVFLIAAAPASLAACAAPIAEGILFAAAVLTADVIVWAQLNKQRRRRDGPGS